MDLGIRGRKAIINGGSAGLGRGAAVVLAREGAELFISARREDRLLRACDEIRQATGASVTPVVADNATEEGRRAILDACPAPDILVGTCSPPPYIPDFRTISAQDWRDNLELTLISPIELMKGVIDGMIERKWGRIVNIATSAAKYPHPLRPLSGSPRAALINYSVALARQVVRHNVTINTVLPGLHDTDGIRQIYAQSAADKGISVEEELQNVVRSTPIPAGRPGNAEDCGAFVALFCSQQSGFVTGQSLVINGGSTNSLF